MAKKHTLPEHVITDAKHVLSAQARNALNEREKVNYHTGEEIEWKEKIATNAEALRTQLFKDGEIAGKITITPPNQTAVRVEFQTDSTCRLDPDEMDNLDRLFGDARTDLFEEVEEVISVDDPLALIETLTEAGLDPTEFLKIDIKKGMHQTIIEHGVGITTDKFICAREGFLSRLTGWFKDFSEDAKEYTQNFLAGVLKPKVVLGTKTKKK